MDTCWAGCGVLQLGPKLPDKLQDGRVGPSKPASQGDWRFRLRELNHQGDEIARKAKFAASQSVLEKQMGDLQLEGLESDLRLHGPFLASKSIRKQQTGLFCGPGMQVEGVRPLLSTGKLFCWIGGTLSPGVP